MPKDEYEGVKKGGDRHRRRRPEKLPLWQFGPLGTGLPAFAFVMPSGMYRGETLARIPISYLDRCLDRDDLPASVRSAVARYLEGIERRPSKSPEPAAGTHVHVSIPAVGSSCPDPVGFVVNPDLPAPWEGIDTFAS